MKGKLILINWALSFMGLSIDTESSSLAAVMIMLTWFMISSFLLIRAEKHGVFKQFKNNEL